MLYVLACSQTRTLQRGSGHCRSSCKVLPLMGAFCQLQNDRQRLTVMITVMASGAR